MLCYKPRNLGGGSFNEREYRVKDTYRYFTQKSGCKILEWDDLRGRRGASSWKKVCRGRIN